MSRKNFAYKKIHEDQSQTASNSQGSINLKPLNISHVGLSRKVSKKIDGSDVRFDNQHLNQKMSISHHREDLLNSRPQYSIATLTSTHRMFP